MSDSVGSAIRSISALALTVAALAAFSLLTAGLTATAPASSAAVYPPFELIHETGEHGSIYRLSYAGADDWTYVLIDGHQTTTAAQLQSLSRNAHRGSILPGPWLLHVDQVIARAAAGQQPYTVREQADTVTLRVESAIDVTESVYDRQSGILLDQQVQVDGRTVRTIKAISLSVDGRTVR